MYVYMYVYICMYVRIYVCMYVRVFIYIYVYVCIVYQNVFVDGFSYRCIVLIAHDKTII